MFDYSKAGDHIEAWRSGLSASRRDPTAIIGEAIEAEVLSFED